VYLRVFLSKHCPGQITGQLNKCGLVVMRGSHNVLGEKKRSQMDPLLWGIELNWGQSGQIDKINFLCFCIQGSFLYSSGLASSPNQLCATLNANSLPFFYGRTLTRDDLLTKLHWGDQTACKITFFGENLKMHTDCWSNSPPASFVKKHLAAFNVSVGFLVGLVIEL